MRSYYDVWAIALLGVHLLLSISIAVAPIDPHGLLSIGLLMLTAFFISVLFVRAIFDKRFRVKLWLYEILLILFFAIALWYRLTYIFNQPQIKQLTEEQQT
ncbi:MAG: hypothetical protein ACO1OQ_11165 [Rufibacter sp.]